MTDRKEARESLVVVNRLDPERARVLSRLDVNSVVESLPNARSNLKASHASIERVSDEPRICSDQHSGVLARLAEWTGLLAASEVMAGQPG